jgi:hypothetical protein
MQESIDSESGEGAVRPGARTRDRRARLRNAIARKRLELMRERKQLREHIREIWN